MSPSLAIPLLLLLSLPAQAQVYKCQSASQQTIYSNMPCPAGNVEVMTDIKLNDPQSNPAGNSSNLMRQLDSAVKTAILAGDLNRAQALATTYEHKQWVAEAISKEASQPQKSEALLKAELAASSDCAVARRNLEAASNASLPDAEILNAKTSLMHAACGSTEPIIVQQQVQPSFGYGYGPRYGYKHPQRFGYNDYNKPHQYHGQRPAKPDIKHRPGYKTQSNKSQLKLQPKFGASLELTSFRQQSSR